MAKSRKVLTPRAILACENYLKGSSLKKAMLDAGYAPSYCDMTKNIVAFLKNRQVIEYLRARQRVIAVSHNKDIAYLIEKLSQWMEEGDPRDRSKCAELLMRMITPMKNPEEVTKDDLHQITINFGEARKPEDHA